ncbi:TetR/AcrR family transcriptional regulator [Mycolicibacterium thermoresistibile]
MEAMASANRQVRPYRGVEPAARQAERHRRLLEAGLELLGGQQRDPAELTVRSICREAGLTMRYFYESFTDKDEFVSAVFDWVVADIATTTQAAVAAAPRREQTRVGMANIVRTVSDDPRVGRLLFSRHLSTAMVVRKRAESGALFAMLSGQHVGTAMRLPENERINATAHFVVGGVGQTIGAWLAGEVRLSPDDLVNQLASIIDELANPELFRVD